MVEDDVATERETPDTTGPWTDAEIAEAESITTGRENSVGVFSVEGIWAGVLFAIRDSAKISSSRDIC